jgi:hypothetical protein
MLSDLVRRTVVSTGRRKAKIHGKPQCWLSSMSQDESTFIMNDGV